ncbi:MAG: hypothetical protein WCL08_06045 [Verrucomicrobiota bacterium]
MLSKHIAFLSSSFDYTTGILPFARQLEARGYIVDWISFRNCERQWLLKEGVAPEKILDTLNGLADHMDEHEIDERLRRLENGREPFVNHIVSMDRLVKLKGNPFARRYLAHVEKLVTAFLVNRGITIVSGGRDTALQVSTSKICERIGVSFVVPTYVRLPDDRYGLFEGYTEASLVTIHEPGAAANAAAIQFLKQFRKERPTPSMVLFERRNNQFLTRLPSDLKLLLTMARRGLHDRGNDFTRYTLRRLFGMYLRRRWNAFHTRIAPPFQSLGTRPFVLYAYQMQPESSIDTSVAHYSDQIALIRQIARAVPSAYDFYVKPHPDHIGGLARSRLIEISRIPGVTLINPLASGRALIHQASLIITPAGTMAYEAALYGIPSIIFADQFFGALSSVHRCNSIDALPLLVANLLESPTRASDKEIVDYLSHIFANTVVGRQTSYMGPLTDAELSTMARLYDDLIEVLSHQACTAPNRAHLNSKSQCLKS